MTAMLNYIHIKRFTYCLFTNYFLYFFNLLIIQTSAFSGNISQKKLNDIIKIITLRIRKTISYAN